MNSLSVNNPLFYFTPLEIAYFDNLISYFNTFSDETKSRFGPHPFTRDSITELFEKPNKFKMYVAINSSDNSIIAYTIIQFGWLDIDYQRLLSYGLTLSDGDCTFAPSVTDSWQSKGVGSDFFHFVVDDLKISFHTRRIILWGGVQSNNLKAHGFYKKHGFVTLGEFEHNGNNFDMLLNL